MIHAWRIGAAALFVAIWAAMAEFAGPIIAGPVETLAAGSDRVRSGELIGALLQTLGTYLAGVSMAGLAGVLAGLLLGGIPLLGRVLEPYVYGLAATPRVAFIPLIIVLLGIGFDAKVVIVFLGAVMPVIINTYAGVLAADPDLVEMARAAGASRRQTFRHVLLPGALPFILAGLRLGATVGLINAIVAELYTAVQGLGGLLAIYGNSFRMAPYFAVVLILALLGALVAHLLRLAEVKLTGWRTSGG